MSASRPREWLTRTLVSSDDFRYLRTTRCSVGGNLVVEERRGRREGGCFDVWMAPGCSPAGPLCLHVVDFAMHWQQCLECNMTPP